ncbi:UNVERIFIED_CONTAM: hypothetical protein NCL1_33660 [Trichonephila clavipes]
MNVHGRDLICSFCNQRGRQLRSDHHDQGHYPQRRQSGVEPTGHLQELLPDRRPLNVVFLSVCIRSEGRSVPLSDSKSRKSIVLTREPNCKNNYKYSHVGIIFGDLGQDLKRFFSHVLKHSVELKFITQLFWMTIRYFNDNE